jgi:glycosyltransferase involved in cell wall biosynthesis
MRVLHVAAPGDAGGLERVVQLLAQGQAGRGQDVHLAAIVDEGNSTHPLLGQVGSTGVTTHSIALPGRAYWRERATIGELCRRLSPAVVHTHGYRPDVVDAGVARGLSIPTVSTVHGFTGGDWKNRVYEGLQRQAYRWFDAVVAVSRPLGDQLIRSGLGADRVHVIPNAWQETAPPLDRRAARRALGLSEQGFLVGWVGRLTQEKGADVLIDALAYLTDLPLHVSVLGAGPDQGPLSARVRHLGMERSVCWHGLVPDAGARFTAFDVFVLSSRTEGTPMVLFEAMAAHVPIVATRVGGVPDVVSEDEAVLVAPENPVALADAIHAVHRAPDIARARAGRAHARLRSQFTVPPWLDRYSAVYEMVGATRRTAAAS